MSEHVLQTVALVVVLGIGSQWLAWRLRLPSILLLLISGFLAGPVLHLLDPDALLEDLLMPFVSLSVALILFEGGMTLKVQELHAMGKVVRNLISVGAIVTWALSAMAARYILDWGWSLALLLGAILVVTGPTVIVPLLRQVQPVRHLASTLKWEGILIDPIGALLALLVFEAILVQRIEDVPAQAVLSFGKTILVGGVLGIVGARLMLSMFKRYWVPDFLQNPVSLMAVVGVFALSNWLQHESGLFAVTLMGITLANQRSVIIRHIIEFKENLRVLLIAGLFILLAARVKVADLTQLNALGSAVFVLVLILIVRPLAVAASVAGSPLSWKERLFLAWMAPRGIVAAAVASLFALRLAEHGHPQVEQLVPVTFLVIVCTVAVYGLTASPIARLLGLSTPNPQGVLFVGAHQLARAMAGELKKEKFAVLLVDTNQANLAAARLEGLPTYYGSILSEQVRDELDLSGIGRLMALTPNAEVNTLAALHFIEFFGRAEVYQVPSEVAESKRKEAVAEELQGRQLFGVGMTYARLMERMQQGAIMKRTTLSTAFDYQAFRSYYGPDALLLFVITEAGGLRIVTLKNAPRPQPGQTIIALVQPVPEEEEEKARVRAEEATEEG